MWMGKWTKELDRLYDRYIDIFGHEPDCYIEVDFDNVSYNAFRLAILKSLVTGKEITL